MSKRDYRSYGVLDEEINNDQQINPYKVEKTIVHKEAESIDSDLMENKKNEDAEMNEVVNELNGKLINDPNSRHQENTSFQKYKKDNPLKKRSGAVKWSIRLLKLMIVLMLSPFIAVVLACVVAVVAVIIAAIIACVAIGIAMIGSICFISSQISANIVALGVSISIACLSLGGMITIVSIMMTKGLIGLVCKWRTRKKVKAEGGQ